MLRLFFEKKRNIKSCCSTECWAKSYRGNYYRSLMQTNWSNKIRNETVRYNHTKKWFVQWEIFIKWQWWAWLTIWVGNSNLFLFSRAESHIIVSFRVISNPHWTGFCLFIYIKGTLQMWTAVYFMTGVQTLCKKLRTYERGLNILYSWLRSMLHMLYITPSRF